MMGGRSESVHSLKSTLAQVGSTNALTTSAFMMRNNAVAKQKSGAVKERVSKIKRQLEQKTITLSTLSGKYVAPFNGPYQPLLNGGADDEDIVVQRLKRCCEQRRWQSITGAATAIQKVFRRLTEGEKLLKLLEERYAQQMRQPTLVLQSVYRQLRVQQLAKQEYLILQLRDKLVRAVVRVQACVRKRLGMRRGRYLRLVRRIMEVREGAAVVIQKNFKRYVTQHLYEKVLELERNYISLKWLPSNSSQESFNNVEVIGSFTSPPWGKKVGLDFCPLRGIYVKYINNLTEGTYLIKFIVNGEFRCDENLLPTATDSSGHVNNVLEIGYDNESESSVRDTPTGVSHQTQSGADYNKLIVSKHNLRLLDQQTKKVQQDGQHHPFQVGHSWQIKFREFGSQFYHLENIVTDPVREHQERFHDVEDDEFFTGHQQNSPVNSDRAQLPFLDLYGAEVPSEHVLRTFDYDDEELIEDDDNDTPKFSSQQVTLAEKGGSELRVSEPWRILGEIINEEEKIPLDRRAGSQTFFSQTEFFSGDSMKISAISQKVQGVGLQKPDFSHSLPHVLYKKGSHVTFTDEQAQRERLFTSGDEEIDPFFFRPDLVNFAPSNATEYEGQIHTGGNNQDTLVEYDEYYAQYYEEDTVRKQEVYETASTEPTSRQQR